MIKFEANVASSTPAEITDMLEQTEEIYSAYESVLALGIEVRELGTVIDNMKFAQECISKNGVQWYVDNCDPEATLAKSLGCACEALSTVKVQAGMEGLLKDAWNKISEWVKKFIAWIGNLFKKDSVAQVVESADKQTQQNIRETQNIKPEQAEGFKKDTEEKSVPKSVEIASKSYDNFKKFVGGKEKKRGIFSFLSLSNLKKFCSTLLEKVRALMGKCDGILSKFKSAKSKEEYAVAISEARNWCQSSKSELAQLVDKSGVDDNVIEAEWAEVTCQKAGIKSVEDCRRVAGLLTNNGAIYLGYSNMGKSCDTAVAEIENKLKNTSGDDEEIARLKFQAMQCVMQMMQIRAQILAHSKNMPASLSVAARDISALPLKQNKTAA